MICPECGKELSDAATLCTSCGWKSPKWGVSQTNEKRKKNIRIFAIIYIVVLLIFLAVAIALLV